MPKFPKVQGGKQLPPTISEDGVLDLQGHIVPRRYEDFKEAHHVSLREYHKQNIYWERVKVLKLKYSSLVEMDLASVNRLLKKLPNCEEVDLRGNRFCEPTADEHLLRMVRSKQARMVNICQNPLAAIERRDFFEQLTEQDLERLIWIPESWLEGKKWQNVLAKGEEKEQKCAIVLNTHRAYYLMQQEAEADEEETVTEKEDSLVLVALT
mgnify:CR=1 FL=1